MIGEIFILPTNLDSLTIPLAAASACLAEDLCPATRALLHSTDYSTVPVQSWRQVSLLYQYTELELQTVLCFFVACTLNHPVLQLKLCCSNSKK